MYKRYEILLLCFESLEKGGQNYISCNTLYPQDRRAVQKDIHNSGAELV